MRTLLALVVAAALAGPAAAAAQYDPYAYRSGRSPFYFGLGVGYGNGSYVFEGGRTNYWNHLGNHSTPFQFAWQLEAGATLSPKLLVGGELSGLVSVASHEGTDSTLAVTQLLAVATWFPVGRGVFLRGGTGLAWISSDSGTYYDAYGYPYHVYDSAVGWSALGGVGYAWPLGRTFHLTLHADASGQWYGGDGFSHPSSSVGVNGYLGFRWY